MARMISFALLLICVHWISAVPSNASIKIVTKPYRNIAGEWLSAGDYLRGLQEKIDGMVGKIDGMGTKVDGIEAKIDEVKTQRVNGSALVRILDYMMKDSKYFYFPPGTKDHVAKKFYREYDYTFVGFGGAGTADESIHAAKNTLAECLAMCFLKREEVKTYNGVYYHTSGKICYCYKNEKGHSEDKGSLHYKYFPTN